MLAIDPRHRFGAASEQSPQFRQVLLERARVDHNHTLARSQSTALGQRLERCQAGRAFRTDPPALVAPHGGESSFDFRLRHRYGTAAARADDLEHLEMADTARNVETYTERLSGCGCRGIPDPPRPRVDDWRGRRGLHAYHARALRADESQRLQLGECLPHTEHSRSAAGRVDDGIR